MEKFVLTGKYSEQLYQISLPAANNFKPASVDDLNLLHRQSQKSTIQDLEKLASELKLLSTDPKSMFKGHKLFHKLTLKNYYSKHPFPVAQGPSVPPLDKSRTEIWKESTDQKVFAARTEYVHSSDECLEWIPAENGLGVFGKSVEEINDKKEIYIGFEVKKNPKLSIKGAASLKDMTIVYTCKLHNCFLHCPCTVCRVKKGDCRNTCKQFACQNCSSQCTEHETVGLARQFDPNLDHLTLVTDKLNSFHHGIPYPGIPLSCELCTKDVYEHEILHHVFHLRCKFCRLEARPYKVLTDTSLKGFKDAVSHFQSKDNRTCSYCFLLLENINKRKNHENKIHLNIESKYKCGKCEKSYTNKNALAYHVEKHSSEPVKFSCNDCGKQYRSEQGLIVHREIVHETKEIQKLPCSHCDAVFSSESNVNRHMKVVHEDPINTNLDFVPPLQEVPKFNCSSCNEVFNRKDNLRRHIATIHNKIQEFPCSLCSKKFHRKDHLARHMKLNHK